MQKAADAADISVLFFQLVLIFGPFWVIFEPFRQFWVIFGPIWSILGHFWAILGNFRSFLGHFLWQNMTLCYLNRFLQLCTYLWQNRGFIYRLSSLPIAGMNLQSRCPNSQLSAIFTLLTWVIPILNEICTQVRYK